MRKTENILIVDDNTENLSFLSTLLKEEGYDIFPADSGELALASLEDNIPDLVLLDIRMPGINGFEVCKRIKQNQNLAEIPVIFLTVATEINDKLEGFRLGAVDYVTKPFHKEELLARIKTHLSLYRYNMLFREQSAEKLIESEKHFRMMIEKSPLPMVITNDNQDIEFYNDKFIELFGYTLKDISTADKWWKTCYPDEKYRNRVIQSWMDAIEKAKATNTDIEMQEWEWTIKDKTTRLCEFYMVPLSGSSLIIMNDITDKKKSDEQLKANLREKETLLHEVHHRVKNNMQVINSLLKLQSNNIEDKNIKEILKDSQSRVYAMSAVHEMLHGSEKLSEIDLKSYLSKITAYIFQTYSTNHRKIKLNSSIENSPISINKAYPLGLIINELISNTLKYAFPEDRKGEITVSMKKLDKELKLTIADNGVGISEEFDWKNSKSLGLKLVRNLVENQLDGSIDMESKNGTKFIIKFNIET